MTKTKFLFLLVFALNLQILSCNYPDPTKERNEKTMKKYFADFLSQTDKVEIQYFSLADSMDTKYLTFVHQEKF
jgi:hypothetical protein